MAPGSVATRKETSAEEECVYVGDGGGGRGVQVLGEGKKGRLELFLPPLGRFCGQPEEGAAFSRTSRLRDAWDRAPCVSFRLMGLPGGLGVGWWGGGVRSS